MATFKSLDVGRGRHFNNSRTKLQVVVETAAAMHRNTLDIDFAKAWNSVQVWNHVVDTDSILHLAGHGQASGRIGGKRFRQMDAADFAAAVDEEDAYFPLDVVIADACSTYSSAWFTAVRNSLPRGHKCVYLGTSADIPFDQAELYMQVFVQHLLSRPYPKARVARRKLIIESHKAANRAAQWQFGKTYFRMKQLVGV